MGTGGHNGHNSFAGYKERGEQSGEHAAGIPDS